jgi:hypothetical protein
VEATVARNLIACGSLTLALVELTSPQLQEPFKR